MTLDITAIVLSAKPVERNLPGLTVHGCTQRIHNAAELHNRRMDAISEVRTRHFFFLDDDDDLPGDYLSVLTDAAALGRPLVYTDEVIVERHCRARNVKGAYSQAEHIRNPLLVHHLVLCEIRAARRALRVVPRGWHTEIALYFQMAKEGVGYVPRVGYVWNKGDGMHRRADLTIAQMQSATWCQRNMT